MADDGVTHRELVAALERQTDTIVSRLNRSEDSLKKDIGKVSERVTHIERQSRVENIIASAIAAVAAVTIGWYTKS